MIIVSGAQAESAPVHEEVAHRQFAGHERIRHPEPGQVVDDRRVPRHLALLDLCDALAARGLHVVRFEQTYSQQRQAIIKVSGSDTSIDVAAARALVSTFIEAVIAPSVDDDAPKQTVARYALRSPRWYSTMRVAWPRKTGSTPDAILSAPAKRRRRLTAPAANDRPPRVHPTTSPPVRRAACFFMRVIVQASS